ncbi:kynurenine 3-monooxygenase [Streptomyces diastaticus subsp. diastaticus]|uniref:Kynurenine 3-monooxygenase n=1 Tax=Streptomyces diastaticus subsp. diastaticus TaxID=68040 RepID=A0ABQ1CUN1_STRDI|nr:MULTISPECIES: NAD(P)/FAD-dependent oxidoreductase [Streptomyces]RWZ77959.1 FAD-dependent monooxygenase [Streptomyces albidoflavus]GFH74037.1 kynurenine 3-monooxygenase [Streptomyces diastaticus subsp. diastaticus]GGU27993.1 kynurenine 3-monooxygenase [Streptomyces diastaticus subsp. diastaticus]
MNGNGTNHTDGNPETVIVGAGLVGAVTACYLAPRFGTVTLLEKRADPRLEPPPERRSLVVMLSARGWRALSDLGVADAVRRICVPLHGRCGHLSDGRTRLTPYSRDGQPIWAVERRRLHQILLDAAEATPGVRIRFGQRVRSVDLDEPAVLVEDRHGSRRLTCRRVLGCDGAHSAVRAALEARGARVEVRKLDLAYQEIDVPAGRLDPGVTHFWPAGKAMFAAHPLPSGKLSGSLFMRLGGPAPSYAAARGGQDLSEMFAAHFPEPTAIIPDIAEQLATKAVSTLTTVRCDRWVWRDTFALLGDSCHAMAPFMGQGMNCGFEDARVLVACLDASADWAAGLAAYEKSRTEDADAISRLSYRHYFTMANPPREETSADVLRGRLTVLFPDRFVPLYERCAFSEESYASVLRDDRRLDRLVADLLARYGTGLVSAPDDRLRACTPPPTPTTATLEDSGCS